MRGDHPRMLDVYQTLRRGRSQERRAWALVLIGGALLGAAVVVAVAWLVG